MVLFRTLVKERKERKGRKEQEEREVEVIIKEELREDEVREQENIDDNRLLKKKLIRIVL
jgi:hypothetical protein